MAKNQRMDTRLIRVGDRTIEAFDFGEGDETVILAAGNGRPAVALERLALGLASEGIRTVTYNYRGLGSSSGPIHGITLHDLARDVWDIADSLDAERIHLAGMAFGNRVMRAAATAHPQRTASITLIGAGGQIPLSDEVRALFRQYLDPTNSTEQQVDLNASLFFAPSNAHLAARVVDIGTFPEIAASQVEAGNRTPLEEWASGGSAAMLVLVGLLDRVAVPANGLELAMTRPDTWLIGIPNCGHAISEEHPEVLLREITSFIRRNPS